MLTQANGGLANTFRSQCAPYYEPFYFVKTASAYSGATKNPYWGTHGCTIFFGGGHAATNDNTVTVAEYGHEAITFRRVCDPTPWFGTGTDATTRGNNSASTATNPLTNLDYMEASVDGKPGSPHAYGVGDVVGPEWGGAQHGTFLRVISSAVNRANDAGAVAAHALDFHDTTTASHVRTWRRFTDNHQKAGPAWGSPQLTAFVGPQQRVYIQTNNSVVNVRWFDMAAGTWVTGNGRTFGYDSADGFDSGILFHVPSRALLICMYPQGRNLTIQWMDVTAAQPTLGGTAVLSEALAVGLPWSAGCWCLHNDRIIVGNLAGNDSAVAEVAIPALLTDPWPVEVVPFAAGQTMAFEPAGSGGNTYKKWHYDEKVRAIVYMRGAALTGDDSVFVYRPRNV